MSDRDKMTDALFDAVGSIDDGFVAEAIDYGRVVKRNRLIKTLSAVAAVVLVAIAIFVPSLIGLNSFMKTLDNPSGQQRQPALSLASNEALGYGTSALIWQKDGQEDYSYIVISDAKAKTLVKSVSPVQVASRTEPEIKVWIKFSNGEYVSPQLKVSDGNVGLTTFDYSPELELSSTIKGIINNYESEGG